MRKTFPTQRAGMRPGTRLLRGDRDQNPLALTSAPTGRAWTRLQSSPGAISWRSTGNPGPSFSRTGALEHGAPAMRGDQCADKGCPSKLSDRSPGLFEVVAGYGVNQIALADARPIQAIRFIQDDFVRLSLPRGPFA